jgi:hypothetical protein
MLININRELASKCSTAIVINLSAANGRVLLLKELHMPRGRPATNQLSIAQLEALLEKHRAKVSELSREREKLQGKLDSLDAEIAALGGSGAVSSGRGKRAKNDKSLSETLVEVLTAHGSPMKVANIVDAVTLSGYKSSSPQFRSIVNQALIKDKRFHNTGRGFYEFKKTAAAK